MVDRPILFSAPMVKALLDGRKTQTRRILTKARVFATPERPAFTLTGSDMTRALQNADRFRHVDGDSWFWESDAFEWQAPATRTGWFAHIGYAPGDRLWVREAWRTEARYDHYRPGDLADERHFNRVLVSYDADYSREPNDGCRGKTRVSIHMPRRASRLTLTVTDVRVQRLQDISKEDCLAEGIDRVANNYGNGPAYCDYGLANVRDTAEWYSRPIDSFRSLWVAINGAENWIGSPWVVAVTFTVERRNIDALQVAA